MADSEVPKSEEPKRDGRGTSDGRARLERVLENALAWADAEEYRGWDPYDGLNSPVLSTLCRNWLTRLVGIHAVEKSPANLRPLLRVPRERNPKGIALFAMTQLEQYRRTGNSTHLTRAQRLLDWLRANRSPEFGAGWGYNFDWQNGREFFLPAGRPSIVVSVFCGRAFLEHHLVTDDTDSLEIAADTARFLREHIATATVDDRRVYAYTPDDSFVVVNANALAAAFFARVGVAKDDPDLLARARTLVEFVCDCQLRNGAWYYAVPADDSHLSHDNFHTGFVLEALQHVLDVHDSTVDDHLLDDEDAVRDAYERGLAFYREELFDPDGAPRFEQDTAYPRDAHAAGQALRTFALDGSADSLERGYAVADWAVSNLYDDDGYFYRTRGRYIDDTTPYMRWSQGWMCYGLSTLARAREN